MSDESGRKGQEVNDKEGRRQEADEMAGNENGQHVNDDGEEVEASSKVKSPTTSHFRNTEEHSVWCRYGIPLYLVATLGLLLASHIGSGVAAEYILIQSDGSVFEQEALLQASIFTSVKSLWSTGSYALAILIVFTSIMWPYVKLLLSLFAWMVPFRNGRRRERLIEFIDALGKWSFVDIFVFLIIMVSFRATIQLNAGGEQALDDCCLIAAFPHACFIFCCL